MALGRRGTRRHFRAASLYSSPATVKEGLGITVRTAAAIGVVVLGPIFARIVVPTLAAFNFFQKLSCGTYANTVTFCAKRSIPGRTVTS